MNKTIFVLAALAALSGCGGGGDGSSTTPASNQPGTSTGTGGSSSQGSTGGSSGSSSVPASVVPATTVAAPTYASTDQRYALFNLLNAYRAQMGVGMVRQDSLLDTAAQAHAVYLNVNGTAGGHSEDPAKTGFYGADPRARATVAGVPTTTRVGELISGTGDAQSCLTGMKNSVYHLQSLTGNAETVGLGFATYCTFELGTITGQTGTSASSDFPIGGGQQLAANAIAYSPVDGETVDRAMGGESPRPAPDIPNPGHPVMMRVRADTTADVLSVTTFKLVDSSGADVAGRILIASNAKAASAAAAVVDSAIYSGVAFFLPQTPLSSNATYTAVFSGARNGVAISKSWSFKTYF